MIVPMAVSYDLVLEDRILAHQGTKRGSRPFGREVAEMVRYAVGYQSRAFVTFGEPIALKDYDPESRRDVMALAHLTRDTIGRLYKVLPTAIVAAAMRPGITRRELESRAQQVIDAVATAGGNLSVTSGREAVERAAEPLETRNIVLRRTRRPLPRPRAHRPPLLRPHPAPPARRPAPYPSHALMRVVRTADVPGSCR